MEYFAEILPGQDARGPRPPPPLARPALARSGPRTGPLGTLRLRVRERARESERERERESERERARESERA
jgi:hypothetical protein